MYNPKPMPQTNQEALDNVIQHFIIENNEFSYNVLNDSCMYRGLNGTMCGAGCQISNEKYTPEMEGLSVNHPSVASVFNKNVSIALLMALQAAHDTTVNNSKIEFLEKLRSVATRFKLTIQEDLNAQN